MDKKNKLTVEQLNSLPKDVIVTMCLQLSENMDTLIEQNAQLTRGIEALNEQIAALNEQASGRERVKRSASVDGRQISIEMNANRNK